MKKLSSIYNERRRQAKKHLPPEKAHAFMKRLLFIKQHGDDLIGRVDQILKIEATVFSNCLDIYIDGIDEFIEQPLYDQLQRHGYDGRVELTGDKGDAHPESRVLRRQIYTVEDEVDRLGIKYCCRLIDSPEIFLEVDLTRRQGKDFISIEQIEQGMGKLFPGTHIEYKRQGPDCGPQPVLS